jgi:hypothetical protein
MKIVDGPIYPAEVAGEANVSTIEWMNVSTIERMNVLRQL